MDNPQEGENNPPTKSPMIPNKDNKNHPLNDLSQMTTSLATTQLVSENPEHLFLGQDIYRKEIPNSRKKRTPSPIYPSDLLPTFTDHPGMNHSVTASNISAHTAPELSLNGGFTSHSLRYVPEEPLSQLERPHSHSAMLHNHVRTRHWQENAYPSIPSNTSYSPLVYNSPSYVSETPPERPRPRFATLHHVADATPQYPVNSYLQSPHNVWNNHSGYTHPSYMSETSIPQEERLSWLTMPHVSSVETQYETNNYPSDSRYSPHGHSHPSYTPETPIPPKEGHLPWFTMPEGPPVEPQQESNNGSWYSPHGHSHPNSPETSIPPQEGHRSWFAMPHDPAIESQYESNNYPSDSRYNTHGYNHPSYISEARLPPPEIPRARFATPYNPAANASQQMDNYPSHSKHSQPGYSHPNFTSEESISPPESPRFAAPYNPTGNIRQHPVISYPRNPGNTSYSSPKPMSPAPTMPPERPRPHFAIPQKPAATTVKYKVNSYLNSFDSVVDYEPIPHRQPEAPNMDIPISESLQTIGAKWVRTQCARRMASKLNEIEERHAENAQRFAALMKSLNENTLAANQDNDQSNAAATDAKSENNILAPHDDYQVTNALLANPASHSTRTSKPPHPEFEDTTRDESDIHDEDYPCRIS